MQTKAVVAITIMLALIASARAQTATIDKAPHGNPPADSAPHTLTVSAAISLSDAMKRIAAEYERRRPGAKILLNVGGSGALLQQIEKGAPVDVFASADEATMDRAREKGLIDTESRRNFARNALVVILASEAAGKAENDLATLQHPEIKRIAIGNPDSVPAGRYARIALQGAGLWEALQAKLIPAQNVRQVLEYVARGEVDAGFVYRSDVALLGDRGQVAFSIPMDVTYPIAVVRESAEPKHAARFIEWVLSPTSQQLLAEHGFMKDAGDAPTSSPSPPGNTGREDRP